MNGGRCSIDVSETGKLTAPLSKRRDCDLTGPLGARRVPTNHMSIDDVWHIVADLYCEAVRPYGSSACLELERELLFCLLGGFGVTYEHGRSAAAILSGLDPFSEVWGDDELFEEIVQTLMQPQFEPQKSDGSLRRYRFPRQKASMIVNARRWLLDNAMIGERLQTIASSEERRELLRGCPGVGLKTASWVLRNLGLGSDLAIIDTHVLRALFDSGRVSETVRLPRDYELAEQAFLMWCNELDAPPAAFDLFVWDWQRGGLRLP